MCRDRGVRRAFVSSRSLISSNGSLDIDLPVALEGEDPIMADYGLLLVKLMEIWRRVQDAIVSSCAFLFISDFPHTKYPNKRKEQAYQEIVAEIECANRAFESTFLTPYSALRSTNGWTRCPMDVRGPFQT
jgi:hypothetical protein